VTFLVFFCDWTTSNLVLFVYLVYFIAYECSVIQERIARREREREIFVAQERSEKSKRNNFPSAKSCDVEYASLPIIDKFSFVEFVKSANEDACTNNSFDVKEKTSKHACNKGAIHCTIAIWYHHHSRDSLIHSGIELR